MRSLKLYLLILLVVVLAGCNGGEITATASPTAQPTSMPLFTGTRVPPFRLDTGPGSGVCRDFGCQDDPLKGLLANTFAREIADLKADLQPYFAGVWGDVTWYLYLEGTRFDEQVTLYVRARYKTPVCGESLEGILTPQAPNQPGSGGQIEECDELLNQQGFLEITFDEFGNPVLLDSGIRPLLLR